MTSRLTTPITECSISADAQLTVDMATARGWSDFEIYPNGHLEGTSPDGRRSQSVPNYARQLKEAAPELLAALEQALRYIEVSLAYSAAMTAEQVEARIVENRVIGEVEIGANSANTLARFSFTNARAAIASAKEGKERQ